MMKWILEYSSPKSREPRNGALAFGLLSAALILIAVFWLLLLMDGAWRFSALFSAAGLLAATGALRSCNSIDARVICWLLIFGSAGVFLAAVLGR